MCLIVCDVPCWNTMSKLFERVKEEIISVLPPTIFFFLTLHLVAIVRMLMLTGSGNRGQHAFASNGRCPNPWQGGTSRGHAALHQSLSAQASDLQRRLEDDDLLSSRGACPLP